MTVAKVPTHEEETIRYACTATTRSAPRWVVAVRCGRELCHVKQEVLVTTLSATTRENAKGRPR